jgi:Kazal-type serine protease inhibitor domain
MKAWRRAPFVLLAGLGACIGEVSQGTTPNDDTQVGAGGAFVGCAGPGRLVCGPAEYCDRRVTGRCPSGLNAGICRPRPAVCSSAFQPVCGCDDLTYLNACEAAQAGTAIVQESQCPPLCDVLTGASCPGAAVCVIDPVDACERSNTGVDCRYICQCDFTRLCPEGSRWDSSPVVCACVEDVES